MRGARAGPFLEFEYPIMTEAVSLLSEFVFCR